MNTISDFQPTDVSPPLTVPSVLAAKAKYFLFSSWKNLKAKQVVASLHKTAKLRIIWTSSARGVAVA